jgi:formate hydrogenlyase transcriptional activator
VFQLSAPPLRERRSDIPPLVAFFVERFSRKFGKAVEGVSQSAMEALVRYSWPGNIRELQNMIERSVVLSQGPVLVFDPGMLPTLSVENDRRAPARSADRDRAPAHDHSREAAGLAGAASLEEVERRHIRAVLDQTKGVIEGAKGAAKILNLHPNTLRSRMKKLGVTASAGR